MDQMLPVNEILSDKITKLDNKLIPCGFNGDDRGLRIKLKTLCKLIDSLGEKSARSQKLNNTITTAEKLRNSSHYVYILKDADANKGNGEAIGFLKVGHKHLFLFDGKGEAREVEPLCVLDFFVLQDSQRRGYGKVLFDHMLQDLNATPQELAIDGPSCKMERFLCKNYGIDHLVRQNNNFAIPPQFFSFAVPGITRPSRTPVRSPSRSPVPRRFAATNSTSTIASVIHGHCQNNEGTSDSGSRFIHPKPDTEKPHPQQPHPEKHHPEKPESNPERPSTLPVEPIVEPLPRQPSPAGSTTTRRDSQLTDRGFFNIKFYHNKLW